MSGINPLGIIAVLIQLAASPLSAQEAQNSTEAKVLLDKLPMPQKKN